MHKTIVLNFQGYWRAANRVHIPAGSGIYLVYVCQNNWVTGRVDLKRLIYIGEAAGANQRIAGHEKWGEWQTHVLYGHELCFSFALAGEVDRKRAEAALINHHKPTCNTEYTWNFPYESTTVNSYGSCSQLAPSITAHKTHPMPLSFSDLLTPARNSGGLSDFLFPRPIGGRRI